MLDTFPDPLEAKRALEEQKESLEALEIKKQSDPLTDFSSIYIQQKIQTGFISELATRLDTTK